MFNLSIFEVDVGGVLYAALSTYVLSVLLADSSIFDPLRRAILRVTPKLALNGYKHPIQCRLCISFWASLVTCYFYGLSFFHILPVYAIAYFLATQERG